MPTHKKGTFQEKPVHVQPIESRRHLKTLLSIVVNVGYSSTAQVCC